MLSVIRGVYPETRVLSALGNNDLIYHNQAPNEEQKVWYYDQLREVFFPDPLDRTQIDSFNNGGYYLYHLTGFSVLALNSNYFTQENTNDKSEALRQLDFVHQSLQNSPQKVIIFMHVPFGINYHQKLEVFWED